MIAVKEAILVEGRYDKNTLAQVVDATIIEAGGFGIFHNREKLQFLRQAAEKRGLILFTDSDSAGFLIRGHLKSQFPTGKVLHAYIPEISGKEKRKQKAGKAGLLGVEGMTPEILIEALRRSGAHFLTDPSQRSIGNVTRQDLFRWGLMGGENSREKRDILKKQLGLPSQLSTTGFLDALNLISGREEIEKLLGSGSK